MLNTITSVSESGPLHRKVREGERLVAINGQAVEDVLDYRYWSYDSKLLLTLESPEGKLRELAVKKEAGEDLGLGFEDYLMDSPRGCANRCKFCFIDQLPRGLRKSLYFKDDDARLSFLTGSYITLTNLSERELQRICDLRISPVNISVHTTNPALRAELMGNPAAADVMSPLRRMAEAGVVMDCQIVCCPGINDREELSRTMEDLTPLWPRVNSVSVVPVGLTMHRSGLCKLTPFDAELAAETIERVETFADHCLERLGSRIFFCADELYLKAGREPPPDEHYEDYSQLENGVGLMTLLKTEFLDALAELPPQSGGGRPFSIATGVSAAPLLEKLMLTAAEKCDSIKGRVYPIHNDFFGHSIDVAGLITGGDLTAQLIGRDLGERVLITEKMLRHNEGVFLDDMTIEEASRIIGVPLIPVGSGGKELLDAMLES